MLAELVLLAQSLHKVKKLGQLTETLKYEWRDERTIIKHLTADQKFSLMQECMDNDADIIDLGSGEEGDVANGNFIIIFPNEFNIEIQ